MGSNQFDRPVDELAYHKRHDGCRQLQLRPRRAHLEGGHRDEQGTACSCSRPRWQRADVVWAIAVHVVDGHAGPA